MNSPDSSPSAPDGLLLLPVLCTHLCPLLLLSYFSCKCNICWRKFTNPIFLPATQNTHYFTTQPIWLSHNSSRSSFSEENWLLRIPLPSVYITSNVTFQCIQCSLGVCQLSRPKKKKKICKFIIFPPIYLTPLLENEQKAYCQADRPGQNVTVCSTWAQKYI